MRRRSAAGGPAVALANEKTPKGKRDPADRTDQLTAQADEALAEAKRSAAEAAKGLSVNIQARADQEKAAVDAEADRARERLDAQLKALLKDKSIDGAKSDQLQAEITSARALVDKAALDKKALIDRQTADTLARQATDYANQQLSGQIDALKLQADLSERGTARRDIELRILGLEDQIETAKLEEVIAAQGSSDAEKQLAQLKLDQLKATRGAREKAIGAANKNEDPLEGYIKTLNQSVAGGAQSVEVKGLEALNTGLKDAIMNSRSLGDVFKNVIRAMEEQLIQLAISKYLTLPLAQAMGLTSGGIGSGGGGFSAGGLASMGAAILKFIPFANGTDSAPGGLSLVGEQGPELLNLPRGSQVMPNYKLNNLANLGGQLGGGGSNMNLTVHVDAKDAVLTSTVAEWVRAGVNHAVGAAVPMAIGSSRRVINNDLQQRSRQTLR